MTLGNGATGPADSLAGSFDLSAISAGDAFTLSGFGPFASLGAGSTLSGLNVSFASGMLGNFDRVIVLNSLSTNGSGPELALSAIELRLTGTIVAVPEPGTYLLMAGGLLMLAGRRRRLAAPAV